MNTFQLLHIISTGLALLFFLFAFVTAVLFLLSEHQIKHKKIHGLISGLPSLASLEKFHHKTLYLSFILLTLVIVSGAVFSKIKTGHYLALDETKQSLSFVCWFFYALFLNLRVKQGWQGHKGIVLSLIGLAGIGLLFFVGFS